VPPAVPPLLAGDNCQGGHPPEGVVTPAPYCRLAIGTGRVCPLPLAPMYQVESYRGISDGWRPVGRPRPHAEAVALLQRVRQIRPDFVTRSRCLSPELFPVG
jgi:hypothetical protein